jgi:hypothetical protein
MAAEAAAPAVCTVDLWGRQDYQVSQQQGYMGFNALQDLQSSCCLPVWLLAVFMPRSVHRDQCPPSIGRVQ